jgi:hypothetical protein
VRARLARRLVEPPGNCATAVTDLAHFALITYAVPRALLELAHTRGALRFSGVRDRRAAAVLDERGAVRRRGLSLPRCLPFARFHFGQTNATACT